MSDSDIVWRVLTDLSRTVDDHNPLERFAGKMVLFGITYLTVGPILLVALTLFSSLIFCLFAFFASFAILVGQF